MFYCEDCAKRKGWPESMFRSRGTCEICKKRAVCFEVKSSFLPKPSPNQVPR